jgi:hypothetical protein
MALVAIWLSDAHTTALDKDIIKLRKALVLEIKGLSSKLAKLLEGSYLELY